MSEKNNIIKSITFHKCPHCEKEIFIESIFTPPVIDAIFTVDMIREAKEDCLQRLNTVVMDESKKEQVRKWLDDPNTIFGPGEVENIILSLTEEESVIEEEIGKDEDGEEEI
jgi:hypothetical protein